MPMLEHLGSSGLLSQWPERKIGTPRLCTLSFLSLLFPVIGICPLSLYVEFSDRTGGCCDGIVGLLFWARVGACGIFLWLVWDTDVDVFCWVILVDIHAAESFASPIYGDVLIMLFVGLDEEIGMCLVLVLNSKVMDDEGKLDGFHVVCPQAWYVACLPEAIVGNSLGQLLVCEDASLGGIHPFDNFDIYVIVDDSVGDVIFVLNFLWNEFHFYFHVFRPCHRHVKVEVVDIGGGKAAVCNGDDAAQHAFDGCNVC